MSECDTDVVGNPTMQIAKTAKEVKRFQQQEVKAQQSRFGSKSAPGISRKSPSWDFSKWPKDKLGNPTRQVGDVK